MRRLLMVRLPETLTRCLAPDEAPALYAWHWPLPGIVSVLLVPVRNWRWIRSPASMLVQCGRDSTFDLISTNAIRPKIRVALTVLRILPTIRPI